MKRQKVPPVPPREVTTFRSGATLNLRAGKFPPVNLKDLAHALSNCCRWGGHCDPFYSVAEHLLMCEMSAYQDRPEDFNLRFKVLTHDIEEAIFTDLPAPIKDLIAPNYEQWTQKVQTWFLSSLNILPPTEEEHRIIKSIDNCVRAWEWNRLLVHPGSLKEQPRRYVRRRFENRMKEILRCLSLVTP